MLSLYFLKAGQSARLLYLTPKMTEPEVIEAPQPKGNKVSWKTAILKSAGITLLAFVLSFVLTAPFVATTGSLFSAPESGDFILADMFAQVADRRPVRQFEDRIVVVDIGRDGRKEIAELVELLSLCGPKAVGVDVLFEEPSADDSRLIEALRGFPGLVLPVALAEHYDSVSASGNRKEQRFDIEARQFFADSLPMLRYGAANLPTRSYKGTVREYVTDYHLADGETMPSLGMLLLEGVDSVTAAEWRSYGAKPLTIAYHSRDFLVIPIDRARENAEKFADKIVLVGATDDLSDCHATPVDSKMPGVLIHAHALATMLDGTRVITMSTAMDYALSILLCFVFVLLTIKYTSKWRGIVMRLLQVFLVYLAVWIGYSLFVDNNVICDLSHTLLMITFGLFAVDIWNGAEAAIADWREKRRRKRMGTIEEIEIK